jgi:hypothetical protein
VPHRGAPQHFGCDVVGGAADGGLALPVKLEDAGEPEVSDLDVPAEVEEDVGELEVAVDDAPLVQVLQRREGARQVPRRVGLYFRMYSKGKTRRKRGEKRSAKGGGGGGVPLREDRSA